eukprot:CAMPEP_0174322330 /NCGR_PEP_ID=MMETSP0810-20121108/10931_1 /TAXON_ID=73025 ORGANISM="Eutreptiella gymnastica-like, Strain CCMP1594" /NCGR_SAMPLE_ID=MMETSP0810 /ASSEMBLY_ACC=CAM_ASM_000659 /LENGTH=110 /DNA_ID=CAMNT_0015434113 /DNA_START=485 /DNA_END=817 /DNA_ORIENTATION=-
MQRPGLCSMEKGMPRGYDGWTKIPELGNNNKDKSVTPLAKAGEKPKQMLLLLSGLYGEAVGREGGVRGYCQNMAERRKEPREASTMVSGAGGGGGVAPFRSKKQAQAWGW